MRLKLINDQNQAYKVFRDSGRSEESQDLVAEAPFIRSFVNAERGPNELYRLGFDKTLLFGGIRKQTCPYRQLWRINF